MLQVWQPINWFMWWQFWRDSYWDRRVEAVWYDRVVTRGTDWVEFRSWDLERFEKEVKENEVYEERIRKEKEMYEDNF